MEADILAFAQQVCGDAYVEGKLASLATDLWISQLGAAITAALAVAALVASVVLYALDRRGHETRSAWCTSSVVAVSAAFIALVVLAVAAGEYKELIAWQNDPMAQVMKSVAEAI